ncbi:hypothetical protein VIBNISOn1_410036 [Vibrio nigripulchritudo SOn1]|uniref:Uncharacterized protein n=1 Tax=Vibrio nigripulchritudo SOn1 TaxID=1238450 RepID=A0AAV2VT31_9VIBR|nr:hypothetical protein VIBNISOn1_410036 [Vibrio nigripulchritudo SOn1]
MGNVGLREITYMYGAAKAIYVDFLSDRNLIGIEQGVRANCFPSFFRFKPRQRLKRERFQVWTHNGLVNAGYKQVVIFGIMQAVIVDETMGVKVFPAI